MHSNCRLFPNHILCEIAQRNNLRRASTCDPALKLLNEDITSDIHKHNENLWKKHLDTHWVHRHTTHRLWKTIHGLPNRAPTLYTTQPYHSPYLHTKAKKTTIFSKCHYTTDIPTDPPTVTTTDINTNMHQMHMSISLGI